MNVAVAGGGPGGMVLAYLLARAGIPVTLLESRRDFDRDFRGDSLHPWTLELFDELGLADDLLALPHHPARFFRFHTPSGEVTTADYGTVKASIPTWRSCRRRASSTSSPTARRRSRASSSSWERRSPACSTGAASATGTRTASTSCPPR